MKLLRRMFRVFTQYKGLSKSAYVLFFSRLVTQMGAFIWPMLTLILSIKLGYTETQIAMLFLIIALIFLPAQLIGGKLADKFNKKKIIIVFDIISILFFWACAFVEPGTLLIVFFSIAGLFATMEGPAHEALVIESSLPKERDKVFSLTYLGFNIGFIVGASLGGLLMSADLLSLAFIIDGFTTLTATILIILFVNPIKTEDISEEDKNIHEEEKSGSTAMNILKERKTILYQIILVIFSAFIYDQWTFTIPLHMESLYGETNGPLFYGFLASFNGLVVIVFTPLLTLWLRKMFELPKVILALIVYTISFTILINVQALPIFYIFIFLFTLGEILNSISFYPYLSRRVPNTHRGRINSYLGVTGFIGSIAGKLIIAEIIESTGYNAAYISIAGIALLSAVLTYINYLLDKRMFPDLYLLSSLEEPTQ